LQSMPISSQIFGAKAGKLSQGSTNSALQPQVAVLVHLPLSSGFPVVRISSTSPESSCVV
jgi:hypothetical protein